MPWQNHHLLLALASGAILAFSIEHLRQRYDFTFKPPRSTSSRATRRLSISQKPPPTTLVTGTGLQAAIGSTPLILLPSLSSLTQCSIYAKLELLNPGGSPKDRIALSILDSFAQPAADRDYTLRPGDTVYEGTVGSTGISLATLCRARGLTAHIIMPSDQSVEKSTLLRMLGAKVTRVAPAPIVDGAHFVNVARRLAAAHTRCFERGDTALQFEAGGGAVVEVAVQGRGWFADQFESEANWRAHYEGTGPEIWRQMEGGVDAFVAGAGTGGTISGVGSYLKERGGGEVRVVLADPQGSGLYNKVRNGVFWSEYEREGTRRRDQVDTAIEGIGMVRTTRNFERGWEDGVLDDAVKVTDAMAGNMARFLVEREGLWVGGSSAVNCVAALKTALDLGPGHRVVTVICDSGVRHVSKFWKQIGKAGGEAEVELDDILSGRDLNG